MGYVGWINTYEGENDPNKVRKVDSQMVKELISLGAVMYCKVRSLPVYLVIIRDQTTHCLYYLDKPTTNSPGRCLIQIGVLSAVSTKYTLILLSLEKLKTTLLVEPLIHIISCSLVVDPPGVCKYTINIETQGPN
jgi:hypothetical protein